jgi:NTE family protein
MKADWVLEGGGVKIEGLVGGLAAAATEGFVPSHMAGASAGAIVAAGIAAGYTPAEMKAIMDDLDFRKMRDGGRFLVQRAWNLLRHNGMYKGDYFEGFIRDLLGAKNVKFFGDLLSSDIQDQENPKYRWRLKVVAADLTSGRLLRLPNDAIYYKTNPDELNVANAVRMSMSIPFYFRPVEWKKHVIVDGGLLSNFPIWIFDSTDEPEWPTFGILLKEEGFNQPNEIGGPVSFFKAMVNTMMNAHDRRFIQPEDFTHRTITVPVGKTQTTNFDLTKLEKEWLYWSGYEATKNFLADWDWGDYKLWARKVRGLD